MIAKWCILCQHCFSNPVGNSTRGNGSIVQPIYMPNNTDSRPIIVYNREEECVYNILRICLLKIYIL